MQQASSNVYVHLGSKETRNRKFKYAGEDIPQRAALCRRGGTGMSSSDFLMLLFKIYIYKKKLHNLSKQKWHWHPSWNKMHFCMCICSISLRKQQSQACINNLTKRGLVNKNFCNKVIQQNPSWVDIPFGIHDHVCNSLTNNTTSKANRSIQCTLKTERRVFKRIN